MAKDMLALVMGGSKKPPMMGKPEEAAEGDVAKDSAAESAEGGSEEKFAQMSSEATAAGDHEAAAKAMVSAIKACMGKAY